MKIAPKESWKKVRSDRGQKRFKITVNDPEKPEGEFENLYRFLEERYGYSRGKRRTKLIAESEGD